MVINFKHKLVKLGDESGVKWICQRTNNIYINKLQLSTKIIGVNMQRGTPFLFQGTVEKTDKKEQSIEIDYQSHVIVCGSLARQFMDEFKLPDAKPDETQYFAFNILRTETIEVSVDVKISSKIDYQEERHKKRPSEKKYEHKDNINKDILTSSKNMSIAYQQCQPDFKSSKTTYVVVIGKNAKEVESLINELDERKLSAHYIVRGFFGPGIKSSSYALSYHSIVRDDNSAISDFVKSAKKVLDSAYKDYVEQLKKEIPDSMIATLKQNIEEDIHTEADDFYAKQKGRCVIM